MTHDEMIAVIQAHKDGKKIELRSLRFPNSWVAWHGQTGFNFGNAEFRIAREPRKCWV